MAQLQEEIAWQIVNNVSKKYLIMKVRIKISFMAFLKSNTILEFWLRSILNCYKYQKASDQTPSMCCQDKLKLINAINQGKVKLSLLSIAEYHVLQDHHGCHGHHALIEKINEMKR